MITTIENIFREIQPENSFSIARRLVFTSCVHFNGGQVTSMMQEVDVKDGSTFQYGKRRFLRTENRWVKVLLQDNPKPETTKGIKEDEGSIAIGNVYFVFPKYPLSCDYVRVVNRHSLSEIVYWSHTEWAEDPEEVMGAIIGALCKGLKNFTSSPITS